MDAINETLVASEFLEDLVYTNDVPTLQKSIPPPHLYLFIINQKYPMELVSLLFIN
jgi:hypothetical protein